MDLPDLEDDEKDNDDNVFEVKEKLIGTATKRSNSERNSR